MLEQDLEKMSIGELTSRLRKLDNLGLNSHEDTRRSIRVELFKRGVHNINGIPLETLLRNPTIKEDYEEAQRRLESETL